MGIISLATTWLVDCYNLSKSLAMICIIYYIFIVHMNQDDDRELTRTQTAIKDNHKPPITHGLCRLSRWLFCYSKKITDSTRRTAKAGARMHKLKHHAYAATPPSNASRWSRLHHEKSSWASSSSPSLRAEADSVHRRPCRGSKEQQGPDVVHRRGFTVRSSIWNLCL